MSTTLKELIYSKCISNTDLHQRLLYIVHSQNWLEDLIDLIIELQDPEELNDLYHIIDTLKDEKNILQDHEEELEQELEELKQEIKELKEENKKISERLIIGNIECPHKE